MVSLPLKISKVTSKKKKKPCIAIIKILPNIFRVEWLDPILVTFNNFDQLYTAPPPGSGILLGFIMNMLDGYGFNRESLSDTNNSILTYHRIIEAFKYAYAKRTELGDTNFINITEVSPKKYILYVFTNISINPDVQAEKSALTPNSLKYVHENLVLRL